MFRAKIFCKLFWRISRVNSDSIFLIFSYINVNKKKRFFQFLFLNFRWSCFFFFLFFLIFIFTLFRFLDFISLWQFIQSLDPLISFVWDSNTFKIFVLFNYFLLSILIFFFFWLLLWLKFLHILNLFTSLQTFLYKFFFFLSFSCSLHSSLKWLFTQFI